MPPLLTRALFPSRKAAFATKEGGLPLAGVQNVK
jgi:hypothetical protein